MNPEHTIKISDNASNREMWIMQLILITPCFFMKLQLDNDAYWLIQAGRDLLQNGIPHVDPLTFHEGLHYVMQQWITAGIYAFLYDSVGMIGILLFVLAIFIAIVLVLFKLCMLISGRNLFISFVVTILDAILLFLFITTRPYPISMLIFLIEIFILEKYLLTSDKRILYLIPFLSLLLINLHGAIWPFFFIILIPYIIDSFSFKMGFVKGEGYPRIQIVIAFAIAFIAGFFNPYGWELMTYLFRSYGNQGISSYVNEMQSPNFQDAGGLFVFIVFSLVALALVFRKPPRLKLRFALLIMGTVFMTLTSVRNLSLFAICGFPMLAFTFMDYYPNFKSFNRNKPHIRSLLIIIFIVAISLTFTLRLYASQNNQDALVPSKAVDLIVNEYEKGEIRLFTDYNWGGYAEFRGLKPFIDARAEVFIKKNNHKADILDDYIAVRSGRYHYAAFIEQYGIDILLVEKTELLGVYLSTDNNYSLVFQDDDFAVYQKIRQ